MSVSGFPLQEKKTLNNLVPSQFNIVRLGLLGATQNLAIGPDGLDAGIQGAFAHLGPLAFPANLTGAPFDDGAGQILFQLWLASAVVEAMALGILLHEATLHASAQIHGGMHLFFQIQIQ
jgi:hypothetical protein